MRSPIELFSRLRDRLHRDRLAAELREELAFHRRMLEQEQRDAGADDGEARRAAARALGNQTRITEDSRDMWSFRWMEDLAQDVRYAVRGLRRAPVFLLAAVLTLGIGAGSSSAVFSLLEGVVLRPLPYPKPDRLVTIWEANKGKALAHERISPVNFMDYRELHDVFEDAAAWWRPQLSLSDRTGADPVRVDAVEASRNLFDVLGVQPALGRSFTNAAAVYGGPQEVVISDRLFESRYGGDRSVIGRSVQLDGYEYQIVGVMPKGFDLPAGTDVWEGLGWDLHQHSRGAHFMESVARLRPGVTPAQANAALAALTDRLAKQFLATNQGWRARAVPLDREVVGVFRPALFALFGASGLLLLIACINVANLSLARAGTREREVAVRAALGASRTRLIRFVLTESAVLAVAGTLVGCAFSIVAVKALLTWTPIPIPRAGDVGVDLAVLLFGALVATVTAFAFGLAPAFIVSRGALHDAIKDGARGSTGRGRRGRSALVVAEVTLAVMLLAGAGLLVRSIGNLLRENSGVDPSSVAVADIQLPAKQYTDWPRVTQFYEALLAALRARPEVSAAGATNFLPLKAAWRIPILPADQPRPPRGDEPQLQHHTVDDGYFAALRVPMVAGRSFDATDKPDAPTRVIVNAVLAHRFWPNADAVGKRVLIMTKQIGPLGLRLTTDSTAEVVGVVSNIKNLSLADAPEPTVYFSQRQFPFLEMHLVVRARSASVPIGALIRDEMRRLDASVPLPPVQSMERVLTASTDPPRFVMFLMSVFAVLALALAAVGIFGILSYTVSQRRREFAVRLALGARPSGVLRHVVREGLVLAGAGCALGIVVTAVAGRVLGSFLYQVKPWDSLTMSVVLALMLGVAAAACVAPGRRAAGEDPARALRGE